MFGFAGFVKGDFMRIYCEDSEREKFYRAKDKFDELAKDVYEKLETKGLRFRKATPSFPDRDIGWHGFYNKYKGPKGGIYFKCTEAPHFSIFQDNGVSVKLHVAKQPLKDLRKKINDEQKKEEFFELLKNLKKKSEASGNEYIITISELEKSDTPHTSGNWSSEYSVYSYYIDDRKLETIADMILDDTKKVWFNIHFTFDPNDAEELKEKIVDEIVKIIEDWWDIYSFVTESL